MDAHDEIARLQAQLRVISGLLNETEQRLRDLGAYVPAAAAPPPPNPQYSAPPPPVTASSGFPAAPAAAASPPGPRFSLREFLTGPRGLAVVGATILILGLAFLFVIASQRGILGPTGRTITGALASFALIGAGLVIEHRRAGFIGAIAAVGAGIAGLYMALVTATRIFDLIPSWLGLVLAGGVAAFAVVIAHRWRSQLVAAFGLCGALAAPILLDVGITPTTIGFVLILAAAVAWLWLAQGWHVVAIAGGALSGLYVLALVASASLLDRADTGFGWNEFWQSVLGAGLFWALLVVVAFAHHRMPGEDEGTKLATTLQLTIGTGALAILGTGAMFRDSGAGWALLAVAGVYALLGLVPRLLGRPNRALTLTLALVAVAALFAATLDLLDGGSRATVLALQGGGLAVAAAYVREVRVQWAAAAYLCVATLLTIGQAAPIRDLFVFPPEHLVNAAGTAMDGGATLRAIVAVIALAAGFVALAWSSERLEWGEPIEGATRPAVILAAAAILLAVATVIVDIGLTTSFTRSVFQGSHALVSIVWGVAALAILVVGLRRRARLVRTAGLALLGVTLAKLFLFDVSQLTALSRAVAFVIVGLLFVAGSVAYQRMSADLEPDADV
jgi:uncharacterized membrane protein